MKQSMQNTIVISFSKSVLKFIQWETVRTQDRLTAKEDHGMTIRKLLDKFDLQHVTVSNFSSRLTDTSPHSEIENMIGMCQSHIISNGAQSLSVSNIHGS